MYLLALRLAAEKDFAVALYVADLGQAQRAERGVSIVPVAAPGRDLRLTLRHAVRIVRRLVRARHDLYVTRSASGVNGLVSIAARRAGARHVHMCAADRECNGEAEATLSRPARWLHDWGLRRADALTCQSLKQQQALRSVFHRQGVVMPNLLPDAADPPADAERRGALWVGRDVECKKPELFIDLARRLPEHAFTMVCQPQPGQDTSRLARSAPPNLRFIPGLPFHETARLFAAYRVLVSTSSAEGFQNTMAQAFAAGTPVVTLATDPDGILTARGLGKTCGGDIDMLVKRVQEYLADDAAWDSAHQQALAWRQESRAAEERLVEFVRGMCRG